MTTIAVLQPGYLPWIGFFNLLKRCDTFIYYDDVQFDKHGWRNRNRIKTPDGMQWLTVPVFHKSLGKPDIKDIRINNQYPWAKKHIGTIRWSYANAEYFDQYFPELESLLNRRWDNLIDLDIESTNLMSTWFNINRTIYKSSDLPISGDRNERLVNICKHFDANQYITGDSAKDYLDIDLFEKNNIKIIWQDYKHPEYKQLYGNFTPYLSALDLIMNMGSKSGPII